MNQDIGKFKTLKDFRQKVSEGTALNDYENYLNARRVRLVEDLKLQISNGFSYTFASRKVANFNRRYRWAKKALKLVWKIDSELSRIEDRRRDIAVEAAKL